MVKLRLRRLGSKKKPFFRLVAADKDSPRDGRFIETLGIYSPRQNPQGAILNKERVLYWLSKGAIPTGTAMSLLRKGGVLNQWHQMRQLASKTPVVEEATETKSDEV